MLLDIKELSVHLKIKRSTLYAWTSQGRIPYIKIHGLIRFQKEEIDQWLLSFQQKVPAPTPFPIPQRRYQNIDELIEAAKREVYNSSKRGNQTGISPKERRK